MNINLTFPGYKGFIVMRVADNIDRVDMFEQFGISDDELKEALTERPVKVGKKTTKAQKDKAKKEESLRQNNALVSLGSRKSVIKRMLKVAEDYYVEVDLSKGQKKYTSYDDIRFDPSMLGIMQICATKALIDLGDSKKK